MGTDEIFKNMITNLAIRIDGFAFGLWGRKYFVAFSLPRFKIERHDDAVINADSFTYDCCSEDKAEEK